MSQWVAARIPSDLLSLSVWLDALAFMAYPPADSLPLRAFVFFVSFCELRFLGFSSR